MIEQRTRLGVTSQSIQHIFCSISLPRSFLFLILFSGAFFSLSAVITIHGQTAQHTHPSRPSMQQYYDAAQRFQSSDDMEEAKLQYKWFLADALRHIANDRAHIGEYSQATPLFDEALNLTPDDSALCLDYAEAALATRDLAKAALFAQRALKFYSKNSKGSQNAKAHLLLGRALLGMNENKQAKKEFETAVAIDPNFEDGYALATADLALADKADAARIFKEMLAGFGDTAAIHMQFGLAYGNADDPEEALREFKKTIAENNRYPDAHYSLGASYLLRSGDTNFTQAEAEFHKELAIHPNDYFSYSQLGYIAMSQHKLPEAVNDLTRAATLDPQNPDNFLLLGQIYADLGKTADAEKALRKAIEVTTDPSRNHYQIRGAHYQLGRLLIQEGNVAEGKKEMQTAQDLLLQNKLLDKANLDGAKFVKSPFRKTPVSAPADAATEAAVKKFETKISPAIADSYNNLGVIAAMDKDYAGAAGYFAQAAKWNPAMEGLDYNWGRAAFAAHQYAQAVDPLNRALQARPSDIEVRSMLGTSQYLLHDYSEALQTLQPLEMQMGAVPSLAFIYAESMVQIGDFSHGIERLKALEQANPKSAYIQEALAEAYHKSAR